MEAKKIVTICLLLLFTFAVPQLLWATNGMNMIGYGAASSGMGGADLALVDNVTAMNINPAGLAGCCGAQLSIGNSAMQPHNQHRDMHGNDTQASAQVFYLPLLAWAYPLKNQPLIVGLGLFAQGRMGVQYDLRMPFADMFSLTREKDELSSEISYAKLTPTIAWCSDDRRLKIGASLNIGYANAEMSMFPHTSLFVDNNGDGIAVDAGEIAFFGMEMDDAQALATAMRFGFQYQLGKFTLGGAYLSSTKLKFDDGKTRINYSAIGMGVVEYDTQLSGFNWPQQAGLGISYRVSSRLKVAIDVDWIDWSSAMKEITFIINSPDHPDAPAGMTTIYPMHWEDQWVLALGVEYLVTSNWQLRLGYNHGNNPIPDEHLLPFFPAISEDHITIGSGVKLGRWKVDFALEWALANRVNSTNSLFCKHGFDEEASQFTTHLMISYSL